MASTTCGYCGRFSHMTRVWVNYIETLIPASFIEHVGTLPARIAYTIQGAATCDNCGRVSVAFRQLASNEAPSAADETFGRPGLTWHPPQQAPDFPDVPNAIRRAAKEAHTASAVGAGMAAILMARTVVEATAKNNGINTGALVAKIDALASRNLIRPSTQEAAHEIRHFGNDMAHGDIDDEPTSEDVADVLAFMDEVLQEVFIGPKRIARLKERREARRDADAGGEATLDGSADQDD
ncbi:DUF4145 domain-containing protein [Microbacterium sp. HD4P20]|uniref:DUF4145 domain-containing protein n=1 Tax=Microbacterium sp. HD4P20 TaxID=2864874 RepID=UPI001C643045|nr:DUF4145 domain-containing protein [Microbacterium sp. HD4P20]MCP2636761.1 DUF4145 domain-containing protein [Microbacterium sp. HD4P20]